MRNVMFFGFSLVLLFAPLAAKAADPKPPTSLMDGAVWKYSIDSGKTWSTKSPVVKPGTRANIIARIQFDVKDPKKCTILELRRSTVGGSVPSYRLNGMKLKGPLEGMRYRRIPAIPVKLLKAGKNTLNARFNIRNKPRRGRKGTDKTVRMTTELRDLTPAHLEFDIEPVLGAFGKDYFTVTCRTNMPATVKIEHVSPAGNKTISPASKGLVHRIRAKREKNAPLTFRVTAAIGDTTITRNVTVPAFPTGDKLRFVAMGDSRTYPKAWAKVAAAALKAKPSFVVFSGDMVCTGRNDWEWPEEFFGPGKALFAAVPFYAVIGNHEGHARLYYDIFYTPGSKDGKKVNWSQRIGSVLLIGVDGRHKFLPGTKHYEWLEDQLKNSDAKFIFFFNHYPAWSSGHHGKLNKAGLVRETTSRQAQEHIVPLLVKYRATAYINGHDHIYERSELPGGITQITSGGAGAPMYIKEKTAAKQNPHSKVFAKTLHYCLVEIDGETCTIKAITPAGKTVDQCTLKARK